MVIGSTAVRSLNRRLCLLAVRLTGRDPARYSVDTGDSYEPPIGKRHCAFYLTKPRNPGLKECQVLNRVSGKIRHLCTSGGANGRALGKKGGEK